MRIRTGLLLLLLLSLLSALPSRADELSDLRAENARLRAQLQAAQKSGDTMAATPVAPVAPAAPAPIAAAPAVMPSAAATPSAASSNGPSASAAVAPAPPAPTQLAPVSPPAIAATSEVPAAPPGYKLVRVAPLPPSERYLDTGCSRGLFQGPQPAAWNDVGNWDDLQRQMTPQQVEALIGTDHHDVASRGQLQWQYGRCGDTVSGWVLFENGSVRSWSAPER